MQVFVACNYYTDRLSLDKWYRNTSDEKMDVTWNGSRNVTACFPLIHPDDTRPLSTLAITCHKMMMLIGLVTPISIDRSIWRVIMDGAKEVALMKSCWSGITTLLGSK